jgi:hypothetical protein
MIKKEKKKKKKDRETVKTYASSIPQIVLATGRHFQVAIASHSTTLKPRHIDTHIGCR